MKRILNNLYGITIAFFSAFYILGQINNTVQKVSGQQIFIFTYLLLVCMGILTLVERYKNKVLKDGKLRAIVLIGSILLSIFCISQFVDESNFSVERVKIKIVATGEKNESSSATEVWITGLKAGEKSYDLSEIGNQEGWELRDGAIVSHNNQPKHLEIDLPYTETVNIDLLKHSWSGKVEIQHEGKSVGYDLYSLNPETQKVDIQSKRVLGWNMNKAIRYMGLLVILYSLISFLICIFLKKKLDLRIGAYCVLLGLSLSNIMETIKIKMNIDLGINGVYVLIILVLNYYMILKVKENKIKKIEMAMVVILSILFNFMTFNYGFYKNETLINNTVFVLGVLIIAAPSIAFVLKSLQTNIIYSDCIDEETYSIKKILLYALPCIIIWSIYLVAFNPALMSSDSIDQWIQKSTMNLSNWHPALHTILILFLTKIWNSPMLIGIIQILTLAFVFAYGMTMLEKRGLNKKIIIAMVVGYAISPANGFLVNTVWKDIPYAIAMLSLTIYMYKLYISEGELLKKRSFGFVISLVCVYFFRHNGIVPYIMSFLAIIIIYRRYIKYTAIYLIITLMIIVTIKTGVYPYMNVKPAPEGVGAAFLMHQIAYVVKEDGNIDQEEMERINNIVDVDYLKNNYSKYTHDTLAFGGYPYYGSISANNKEVIKLYLRLFLKNPEIVIRDWSYLTNLIWSVGTPKDGYVSTYISITPETVYKNMNSEYEFKELKSIDNKIKPLILKLNQKLDENKIIYSIVWRHGIYLFVIISMLAMVAFQKNKRVVVVFVPTLFNIASLFISMIAQDYRYIYATIVTMPLLIGTFLAESKGNWLE